jgi:capsular polysaccharide biosynthesis protein
MPQENIPKADQQDNYQDSSYFPWVASEYVVNALTDWVKTGTFADEVSKALADQGVNIPAGSLYGHFSSDNVRSVMVMNISWPNDAELGKIANAAIYVMQNRSAAYFPQVSASDLNVVALDTPGIAPVPPSLTARLNPLIRLALGIAAGIGLAFLIEYLDPSLHDRTDVESLGFPVLAEIPK